MAHQLSPAAAQSLERVAGHRDRDRIRGRGGFRGGATTRRSLGRRGDVGWRRRDGVHGDGRRGRGGQAAQQEQFELEPEAAGRAAGRIEAGDPPGKLGQGGGRQVGFAGRAAEPRHDDGAQTGHDLVGEGDEIAALGLEPVDHGDPGQRVAAHEGVDEGLHSAGIGEAEQLADVVGGDRLRSGAEELIEHRLGVAHAPRGELRHEPHGRRLGRPAVVDEDALQLARRSPRP